MAHSHQVRSSPARPSDLTASKRSLVKLSRLSALITFLLALYSVRVLTAQEAPSPAVGISPASAPSATISPAPSPAARSIRISFVPPPLEGKISLGVFSEWDQLVRTLHEQAMLDEFTIGPDALVTKWDGKDDYGFDAAPGKYHARGFMVASMKVEDAAAETTPPASWSVRVKLIANPMEKKERPLVDLAAALDDESAFLQTADGLRLFTVDETGGYKSVALGPGKDGKSILVQMATDAQTRTLRVSGVDKMMGFDAGEFELK